MKIARQYSGPESVAFWNTINSIRDKITRDSMYEYANRLQQLEGEVLDSLVASLELDEEGKRK